jgi:hypothetical protein
MDAQAVEESLDNHAPRWSRSNFPTGAMEIEDHLRFAESGREQVPRLGTVDTAIGISDQPALAIVDRKCDSTPQKAGTSIIADSKLGRRGQVNSPVVQVRMPAQRERERQRLLGRT